MSQNDPQRPYLLPDWPKSDGRTFLAHAFAFFCVLEWGSSFEEMDAGFDPASDCDPGVRFQILAAVQNFGRVIQQGRLRTYARPIGGGPPRPLPQEVWELDDFALRFGASALDPADPFNKSAVPTHWIFVDTDQLDEMLGLVQGEPPRRQHTEVAAPTMAAAGSTAGEEAIAAGEDRYLRKSEVLKLVPFSRSTFDDRVRRGLFPQSHDVGGGIVVWWESAVLDWMREKGRRSGA